MTLFPDWEARHAIEQIVEALNKTAQTIVTVANGERKTAEKFLDLFEKIANNQTLLATAVSELSGRIDRLERLNEIR
jgi:low affinity Fe/Cu permease